MPKTTRRKAKGKAGAPSKYDPAHCERLVAYLAKGYSFESFGSEVHVHRDTLYEWAKVHPAFSDAKKLGEAHRERFLIEMGYGIALGTHRSVVGEAPVKDGEEQKRGKDGKPLTKKVYGPSRCNAAAWIFMCKNMLGWRDRQDVQLAGTPGGEDIPMGRADMMSHEDRLAELERLQKLRAACSESAS